MRIILNNSSMVPIYEQLVNGIKAEISSGGLREGEALPSVRAMAAELRISALTVKKSYDKLEEEGCIVTVHGKGSFIAPAQTALQAETRRRAAEAKLEEALEALRACGMTRGEINELIGILTEDSSWSK